MKVQKTIVLFLVVVICLFILSKISLLIITDTDSFGIHYSLLAADFLKGKIDINYPKNISQNDFVFFKDRVYIAFAPFPAIILALITKFFANKLLAQMILTFLASFVSLFLIYKILKISKISKESSWYIIIWFFFGSFYLFDFQRITTWGLQHTVALTFVFAAILSALEKRSYFYTGILLSAAFLSRYTMIFYFPLLISLTFYQGKNFNLKQLTRYFWFLLPLLITFLIFFLHNYLRFQNFLEVGHSLNTSTVFQLERDAPYGIINYRYIYKNLIGMFTYPPLPLELISKIFRSKEWQFFFSFIEPTASVIISALLPIWIIFRSSLKKDFAILATIFLFFISTILWFRLDSLYLVDALPAIMILLILALKRKMISEKLLFGLILYSLIFNFYWNIIQLNRFF